VCRALPTAGEHERRVDQDRPPFGQREALALGRYRCRERIVQAQTVRKCPEGVESDVADDLVAAGFHNDGNGAVGVHLGSALLVQVPVALTTTVSPTRRIRG